ncbi:PLP-dependent aminotransferase family protein [Peribacillus sp. SCS-155]|uniref:MocR-like pyridoxine biosynthesis transcription factor PdxR n=1 Tax=Peribacillus sedimenti TaxID=3115297 RepID=UPI0039061239
MLEFMPLLDQSLHKPLFIQIYEYIKQEIIAATLKTGEKLPSKRKLAENLGVSVNTVQAAYEQLIAEGYVDSRIRKGLYVAKMEDILHPEFIPPVTEGKPEELIKKIKIDFNSGKVDTIHFPYPVWRKLTIQSLQEDKGELLQTGDPQGEYNLREAIASYLYASRAVRCNPGQIIIGAGTQVLTGLLSILLGRDIIYAFENPGFHRTKSVIRNQGIELASIDLDADGISIKELRVSKARAVFITPSHQFPTGIVMPLARRAELLKWADEAGGYIIEDDYDGEFRYKGKPIPSLQGMDSNGRVIYLGTFSKSLIPSIRLSYIVLPIELAMKYRKELPLYKQSVSRLHQDTICKFIEGGHWQTHLNKMRTLYRKKQNCLLSSINDLLGENVTVMGEKSGLHIVLQLRNTQRTESALIQLAADAGIKVYPVSIYYDNASPAGYPEILLGYGGLTEAEITEGIRLLKKAWDL